MKTAHTGPGTAYMIQKASGQCLCDCSQTQDIYVQAVQLHGTFQGPGGKLATCTDQFLTTMELEHHLQRRNSSFGSGGERRCSGVETILI